jgi:hypothetical protein
MGKRDRSLEPTSKGSLENLTTVIALDIVQILFRVFAQNIEFNKYIACSLLARGMLSLWLAVVGRLDANATKARAATGQTSTQIRHIAYVLFFLLDMLACVLHGDACDA